MYSNQSTSDRIKAIGFVCAVMVVAIHCTAIPKGWWDGSADIPGWVVALQTFGTDTFARLAVPWFFVISGFFLVKGFEEGGGLFGWWRSSVSKRVLTLCVPYLIWNLIYYLFKLVTGKYGFEGLHCVEQLTGCDLHDVPACGQFWYLRNVLVYVALAPVFVLAFRNRIAGILFLSILLGCWFAGVGYPFRYMQITDYSYVAYFGAGVYLGLRPGRRIDLGKHEKWMRPVFLSVTVLSVVGILYGVLAKNAQIAALCNKVLIIAGVPALWFAGGRISSFTSRWKNLYGLAFFIYAAHVILVSVTHKIAFAVLSPVLYDSIGYLLKIAVGVFGSIAAGIVLARISPRSLRFLCGGRS